MKKMFYLPLIVAIIAIAFLGTGTAGAETKVLRIASSETIRDWDGNRATGHYEPELKNAVFDRLIATKPGTNELVPGLAESWEYSDDRRELIFKLKKGVQFQKGYGELTAEDVQFTYMRAFEPKWELVRDFRDNIEKVEVIDKYTVKVRLQKPNSSFLPYQVARTLNGVIVPKEVGAMSVEEVRKNPIGSGPYELEEWVPMDRIILKRFEGYHGEKPYFDRIEYSIFPNQTTLELALEKGDVDLGLVSYKALEGLRKRQDLKIYTGPSASYAWIGFNTQKKPFDDVRVRKAIRDAVDVDEILLGCFDGAPKRARSMFPPELRGYWKDAPLYKPDIAKAKKLLAEAGYPNGFTVSMNVNSANRGDLVVPVLIEQLRKIGLTIKATTLTRPAHIAELQAGVEDMYYLEYRGYARDPYEAALWWTCKEAAPAGWNMSKWCSKEFDQLMEKAKVSLNENEQIDLYIQMQKVMDEEVPAIWIHNGLTAIAYKKEIALEDAVDPDGRLVLRAIRMK